ncbi:hypothetical protein L227DRAFT_600737 [Lentinus tigrinus ALCF2SS1-6]|uniref:Uncharacterized protein n=1 Tax=Lentinus tigrinus ALCF2SS1-6 TaxID=1328759 RepID=A0A5C2SGI4_9APHY|nr:hypothetical protein L227DRAFT_600737 [Lentinus tigrinus ALCF2SS1-6]
MAAAPEPSETNVLKDYPKPLVHHCSIDDTDQVFASGLRLELNDIQSYCERLSVTMVVEIEQLCLAIPDQDGDKESFYRVPDKQRHRLVKSSSTAQSQHYRWLCFSTPASIPPPYALGHSGDIWVTTGSRVQNFYYRTSVDWRPVSKPSAWIELEHPFAPDLYLAFGIYKLGWFPQDLIVNVFPDMWKARGGLDAHQNVARSAMVKTLYETTGRPFDYGDASSSAVVPHSCVEQSRPSKQWHAERVRIFIHGISGTADPFKLNEDVIILRLGNRRRMVDQSRIKTYAKNFDFALAIRNVIAGPAGEYYRVYDLDPDVDMQAFVIFLYLIKTNLMPDSQIPKNVQYSTSELMSVLRICASDKLKARKVKEYMKHCIWKLWSFSLTAVTRDRLHADAPEALIAARWNRLPQVKKRAIFELIRSPDALDDILQSKYPREWFLSDVDMEQLWQYRDTLGEYWRTFVMSPPQFLQRTCPTYGPLGPCSAARRRCVAEWAVAIGEKMVEGEYRYDLVGGMEELCGMNWRSFGLCLMCVKSMVRLCEEKKLEWWERLDAWIEPERWCVNMGEVEPDEEGNMPYVDSDEEEEGSGEEEIDEAESEPDE